jgi:hypothetical protein
MSFFGIVLGLGLVDLIPFCVLARAISLVHFLKKRIQLEIFHQAYFVHEQPESGRMIQFRFMKNGLLKGQHCI